MDKPAVPAQLKPDPVPDALPKAPPLLPPADEHGGVNGLEPTRYGDWERNGRCTDF